MSADRTEKLSVTRSHTSTMVKCIIIENGVTSTYTVKTYESQVGAAAKTARAGAERLLKELLWAGRLSAVNES